MPIYLQALRGKSAFNTGLIILPMAISGAIATVIAGRLYDKIGPRLLVGFGFGILIINTWQLSQIKADTPISWIVLLLVLRGLALGSTVQTTFVTALSVVPLNQVARGSSLTNASRQVVQSIGVAILATVLTSTLSPLISNLQTKFQEMPVLPNTPPIALCDLTPATLAANAPLFASAMASGGGLPALGDPSTGTGVIGSDPPAVGGSGVGNGLRASPVPTAAIQLLNQACQENIAGFERAYTITFYAAILALALGLMLPGWPFKWAGRRSADHIVAVH
jgi:hypothetical protein